MGDRANVHIKDANVYLYSHWGGYNLAPKVKEALAKKARWSDSSYLARIVFCTMVKGDEDSETGFGISDSVQDNENPIIVLDPGTETISIQGDDSKAMPFSKFITLSDDDARKWHLGEDVTD